MLKDGMSTHDKILYVTVDLIKKEDISSITVRKVAELAGVNIAAVNYHFQSKENLINLATNQIIFSFKDIFTLLDRTEIPATERFKKFLITFAEAIQQFPDPIKRIISSDQLMLENRAGFLQYLHESARKNVEETLSELTGETDPTKLYILSVQIFSAITLPNLLVPLSDILEERALPNIEYQVTTLVDIISK